MKRKLLPPFLMLFAGAITSIIMYGFRYETKKMLLILFGVLIIFGIIGNLLKVMLDIFDRQNEQAKLKEEEEEQEQENISSDGSDDSEED